MDMRQSPLSRRVFLTGAMGGTALAVAGCQAAVHQSSQPSASGSPRAGGTLTLAQSQDAQPNALQAQRAGNLAWRNLVYETLTRLDTQRNPQPLLARSWRFNTDMTSLTLTLRSDVRFHTGRAMTADDVVFSLKQVAANDSVSQLKSVAQQLNGVTATGPHEVTVTMSKPLGNSLFDLFELTSIIDRQTASGIANGSSLVGTGPFMWHEWSPGASLTLLRNPHYRVAKRPYLDRVDIPVITDSTALQSALLGGRAQLVFGMTPQNASPLRTNSSYRVIPVSGGGTVYPIGVNVTNPPFDKKEVRQAIGWAIDRDRIRKQVFAGEGTTTDLWWTPGGPGFPSDLSSYYTYQPSKAKALISGAGAAGAAFPVAFPQIPTNSAIFSVVLENLKAIGLNPTGHVMDVTQWDAAQIAAKLGPVFLPLHGLVGFSAGTMLNAMPSLNTNNPSHFSSPTYDSLRAAVEAAGPQNETKPLHDLTAYLLDQAFSNVIIQAPELLVRTSTMLGMSTTALGGIVLTDAYLSE